MTYELSAQAARDLSNIGQYTMQRWGSDQWPIQRSRLLNAFEQIAQFPAIGRSREDIRAGTRGYIAKPFVILYRIRADKVVLLCVFHERQDVMRSNS